MAVRWPLWQATAAETAAPPCMDILTRREALDIAASFLPKVPPVGIQNFGYQVGGWYYALWVNAESGDKMVCRFNRADTTRKAYFVAHWDRHQSPSRQEVVDAIERHADGLQRANLLHGVVIKRGHVPSQTQVWTAEGFEIVHDVSLKNRMLATYTTDDARRSTLVTARRRYFIPGKVLGFEISLPHLQSEPPEQIAEDAVMDLFHHHITATLQGLKAYYIDARHPHYHAARAQKFIREMSRRGSRGEVEAGDTVWEILGLALGGFSLVSGVKSLAAITINAVKLYRGVPSKMTAFPGAPDLADPYLDKKLDDSKYIEPLSAFFRPVKSHILNQGQWLGQEDFGMTGLVPLYHHSFAQAVDAELLLLLQPPIGSEICYYSQNRPQSLRLADNVHAIRIYRPDGLVVTMERPEENRPTFLYMHYEALRNKQPDKKQLFSDDFHAKVMVPGGFKVFETSNLLLGHQPWRTSDGTLQDNDAFRPANMNELNRRFKDLTGDPFVRPFAAHRVAEAATAKL